MNQSEESIGDQRGVPVNEGPLWENEAHEPPLPGTEVASQRILVATAWGPPTGRDPPLPSSKTPLSLHHPPRLERWSDTPRMNRSSE